MKKKTTQQPEPTPAPHPFMTPAIDCAKPQWAYLKHTRSFVSMDNRPLPRVWEK